MGRLDEAVERALIKQQGISITIIVLISRSKALKNRLKCAI